MPKHLTLLCLALVVVLGVLGLASGLSAAANFVLVRLFGPEAELDILLWALVLAGLLMPRDWLAWNRPCRIVGQTVIDATPGRIWDDLMPRTRDDFYLSGISRVDAMPDNPNRFIFHRDDPEDDSHADPIVPLEVQVLAAEHSRYLHTRVVNRADMPFWGQDLIGSEVHLRRLPDGTVGVMFVETLERLRLPTILALLVVNPCRDAAEALKSKVEGRNQVSWFGRITSELGGEGGSQITRDGRRVAGFSTVLSIVVIGAVFYVVARDSLFF